MEPDSPVLAEVVRSGFTESRHRGTLVALRAGGSVALRAGDPDAAVFPRSVNKPLQAAAMVEAGLSLEGPLLALAAASHSGEDFHVAAVRDILRQAGLTEEALGCPPGLPLGRAAEAALLRAGGDAAPVYMNCSGKHAAMLATCVQAGWPAAGYLDPEHPLQQAILRTVERTAGERAAAVGVDGCGAPLFALSVAGIARAMRALVLAAPGTAERKVADAMRAHPEWTSGTDRPERALMAAVPGLLLKSGAEGVEGFALPDGRAAAYKIEDGAGRARPALTVALLRFLAGGPLGPGAAGGAEGAAGDGQGAAGRQAVAVSGGDAAVSGGDAADLPGADWVVLTRLGQVPVLGGGRPVGEIRVTLPGS